MAEGMDLAIESLKEQLNDIKAKISICRKKGMDTKVAELKIMAVPSKIKMIEVTKDYKDVQKVSSMLDNARAEIESTEKEGLNSENEISKSDGLQEIFDLMKSTSMLLNEKRVKDAKIYYLKCVDIYKKLPEEDKRKAFKKLDDLRTSIGRG